VNILTNSAVLTNDLNPCEIAAGASVINDPNATLTNNSGAELLIDVGAALTNSGLFTNNGTVVVNGTVTNNGTFTNGAAGNLILGGSLNNNSGGSLNLGGGILINAGGTLGNGGGIDLTGTLTLSPGGGLNNNGTLSNGSSGVLALGGNANNGGTLTNAGTVMIQAGGTLNNLTGSTYAQTAGKTIVAGTLNSVPAVQIQGGTLVGDGNIIGNVNNTGGGIQPGSLGMGTLTINGNYTQGSGGTLIIGLGGTGSGDFGVLNVTGMVTKDGTVDFTALNGFTPTTGDDFTFLLFGADPGNFSDIVFTNWSCPTGDTCTDEFGANSLTLDIDSASETSPTPEPSSLLLLGTGIPVLGVYFKRKMRLAARG
jgi:hypothetical protein